MTRSTAQNDRRPSSVLAMGALSIALLTMPAAPAAAQQSAAEELPPGVEQIIPRGGIPAIFAPTFVRAEEAELPDDAWVLGVEIDGTARAYSLNLLNQHEVVNDRIGDKDFAAVW